MNPVPGLAGRPSHEDSPVTLHPSPAPCSSADLQAAIDRHLLDTVGVEPAEATPTDLMQAVSQVARQQLSQRWVAAQARERDS